MISKRLILFLFFTALASIGLSKTFSYRHFTSDDGLPSSETYDVLQDNDGFIWIATDRGVVRYDGYDFEIFNTDNGLPDNVVYQLFKDFCSRQKLFALKATDIVLQYVIRMEKN